jgi:alkylation response protein AidB-like acyl-CoA dehydrogenase
VDFSLSDEQELLVDTARSLLTNECGSEVVRSVAADPEVARHLFDRHLRDWVALAAPPPEGSQVDFTLFLVECGAAVAPGPFLATAGLFAPLLAAAGHELADAAASGEVTGTVAVAGADGIWRPSADAVRTQVIDAHLVDHVAIVLPGPSVAVVAAGELERQDLQTLDLARQYATITVPDDLAGDPVAPEALDDALERATVAVAAELVGVARWLLDTSVSYARERVQFGRPIGSFQAVQHTLVNIALAYEEAAAAVAHAAMCIDADDRDRHRAVHVAKATAGLAARKASRDGLQVHGGIGYTWEHDLHLRLRRAFADDALCGTHEWHLDRLADLLVAGAADATGPWPT